MPTIPVIVTAKRPLRSPRRRPEKAAQAAIVARVVTATPQKRRPMAQAEADDGPMSEELRAFFLRMGLRPRD
jgi:hypothetical protein